MNMDDSSSPKLRDNEETSIETCDKKTSARMWPCANCHCMVNASDVRCPSCHGIQVEIKGEQSSETLKHWLERLSPISVPRATPIRQITSPSVVVEPDESDVDLEVSVGSSKITYSDEDEDDRPVDPVAVILAMAPSPFISKESLDETASEGLKRNISSEETSDLEYKKARTE